MAKAFASQGDLAEKTISFTEVGPDLWAFTAEGDPNTGVVIGEDSVMIVDAQATPRLARLVVEKVRAVTDKPIRHVVLSHYHAVRVLGASAYGAGDGPDIVMSERARAMVIERGQEDWDSEFARFPRLFEGHEEIPGLTWPTQTFHGRATFYLGRRRVDLMQLGRAHTRRRHRRPRARRERHVHRRHRRVPLGLLHAATRTSTTGRRRSRRCAASTSRRSRRGAATRWWAGRR